MFPKLISFDSFVLPTYGVLVALGYLSGVFMAVHLAQKEGFDKERIFNLGIYLALGGMIGAKAFLIYQDRTFYWMNPSALFSRASLQSAGIFHGGLIVAIAVALWLTHRYGLPFLKTADSFSPGIALGLGIGRLGCFAAGCCWGKETDLPWGVTFTDPYANETVGVPLGTAIHPTQLYESAVDLAIFYYLYRRFSKKQFDGQIFGWFLLLYPTARFLIEFLREHAEEAFFWSRLISNAQAISAALILISIWLLWLGPFRNRGLVPLTISHDRQSASRHPRTAKIPGR